MKEDSGSPRWTLRRSGLMSGFFVSISSELNAMKFLLGRKLKMSQVWQAGQVVPVTVIEAAPNRVTLLRNELKDGYAAVQVSLGKVRREFKVTPGAQDKFPVGRTLDVTVFAPGDKVMVSGFSKGRGFQGVVKRHGFHGGPQTHGQKNRLRAPGSIGSTAPQRVWPGRKMAGHMGNARVSVKNLVVVEIDKEHQQLLLKGAVPGAPGGLLEIKTVTSES